MPRSTPSRRRARRATTRSPRSRPITIRDTLAGVPHSDSSLAALVDELSTGGHGREIRETITRALGPLGAPQKRWPAIGARYVLQLIREHVLVACAWPDRRLTKAWTRFSKALV